MIIARCLPGPSHHLAYYYARISEPGYKLDCLFSEGKSLQVTHSAKWVS